MRRGKAASGIVLEDGCEEPLREDEAWHEEGLRLAIFKPVVKEAYLNIKQFYPRG